MTGQAVRGIEAATSNAKVREEKGGPLRAVRAVAWRGRICWQAIKTGLF